MALPVPPGCSALAQPEKIAAYVPEEAAQLYRAELESGHTPDPQRLDAAVLGVLRPAAKSGVLPAAPISPRGSRTASGTPCAAAAAWRRSSPWQRQNAIPMPACARMMMHAFLGITKEMAEKLPAYLRVLGANERAGRSSR